MHEVHHHHHYHNNKSDDTMQHHHHPHHTSDISPHHSHNNSDVSDDLHEGGHHNDFHHHKSESSRHFGDTSQHNEGRYNDNEHSVSRRCFRHIDIFFMTIGFFGIITGPLMYFQFKIELLPSSIVTLCGIFLMLIGYSCRRKKNDDDDDAW